MLEFAQIEPLHRTPRRTRLRIASHLGSSEFFEGLQRRLSACHGVDRVRTCHRRGSVVIYHDPAFELSSLNFRALGLKALQDGQGTPFPIDLPHAAPAGLAEWRKTANRIDTAIKKATWGQADLPTAVLVIGSTVIMRRPIVTAINFAAEACLKAVLRGLLAPKPKRV